MADSRSAEAVSGVERDGSEGPQLSVILAAEDSEQARETLEHLQSQTVADRVEVLLAGPAKRLQGAIEGRGSFHSARVVDVDSSVSSPAARAAGVVAARAPIVAMAETHCFPEAQWAEALIDTHRGPWAAVGPVFENENPDRGTSWANLLVDYGPWLAPVAPESTDDLPGHNSSYKRSLLLAYGDDLPRLFESESILHWDLRSRGHRLFAQPAAKVRHRNMTPVIASLVANFHAGRLFGALRSREWTPARRALYTIASPLIPVIRFGRLVQRVRRTGRRHVLPGGTLPALLGFLIAHATGEMCGYLTGRPGTATRGMTKYELNKNVYVEG